MITIHPLNHQGHISRLEVDDAIIDLDHQPMNVLHDARAVFTPPDIPGRVFDDSGRKYERYSVTTIGSSTSRLGIAPAQAQETIWHYQEIARNGWGTPKRPNGLTGV